MASETGGPDLSWTHADPDYLPPEIDVTKPSIARVYDARLGGKDNISQGVWVGPYSAALGAKQRGSAVLSKTGTVTVWSLFRTCFGIGVRFDGRGFLTGA
jgi:hypothetical protein